MKATVLVITASLLIAPGCSKKPEPAPTRWDRPATTASATTSPTGSGARPTPSTPAPSVTAGQTDGKDFLPFFPDKGMDETTEKIVRATKAGMAEVAYKKGKDDVITVVVIDTQATPAMRNDFKGATEKVSGYPLKTSGYFKSAILVGDRYQVSAMAQKLKPEARNKWLEKMDLAGLAKVP